MKLWELGDYDEKQNLQNLLFPERIVYKRKNDDYRTQILNTVFAYMARLARGLAQKKSGTSNRVIEFPAWVERSGEISNFLVEDLKVIEMVL